MTARSQRAGVPANDDCPPGVDGTPESTERYWAARADLRLATAHGLNWIEIVDVTRHGDVVDALVFFTLWSSNTAHLPAETQAWDGELADDGQRRPVTTPQIAAALDLPYDTVRRRVQDLVTEGLADRMANGFIVPRRVLQRPEILSGLRRSHDNLLRLLRQADAAGLRA